jgi:AcrR family transcriptional regulator
MNDPTDQGRRSGPATGRRRVIKPSEVRRTELLDAAEAAFVEAGIAAVSVADITTRAGVAKGTFYVHFSSRDDLLVALRVRLAEAAATQLAALPIPSDAGGWPEALDALVDGTLGFLAAHWSIHEILAHQPHAHEDGRGEEIVVDRLRERLRKVLRAGVESGALEAADVAVAADLLFDLLHAAGHRARGARPEASVVAAVTRRMVRGALLRD